MIFTPSEVKTDIEGFNNCPPRKDLLEALGETKVVDGYWKNDLDTLMVMVDNIQDALEAGSIAVRFNVDEFNYCEVRDGDGDKFVIRFWWD